MTGRTFESQGAKIAKIDHLLDLFFRSEYPISNDDNWGEQLPQRGNFRPADIRRAFWKCVIAGGIASHVRDDQMSGFPGAGDNDVWFRVNDMRQKLDSAKCLIPRSVDNDPCR